MKNFLKCIFCSFCITLFSGSMLGQEKYFITVNGQVAASELHHALTHEHLATNFIGADSVMIPRLLEDQWLEGFDLSFLRLKKQNNFFFECTPAYIGRDVRLLKAIAERSGLHIVTNTGWYAAVVKKYLPEKAFSQSVENIAATWEKEFYEGIDEPVLSRDLLN